MLLAEELFPSDVVSVTDNNVVAIVTQSGGRTSHAAILARSYGIPAVAGVSGILQTAHSLDPLIVDGTAGAVTLWPTDATRAEYSRRRMELEAVNTFLAKSPGVARTADGHRLARGSVRARVHARGAALPRAFGDARDGREPGRSRRGAPGSGTG